MLIQQASWSLLWYQLQVHQCYHGQGGKAPGPSPVRNSNHTSPVLLGSSQSWLIVNRVSMVLWYCFQYSLFSPHISGEYKNRNNPCPPWDHKRWLHLNAKPDHSPGKVMLDYSYALMIHPPHTHQKYTQMESVSQLRFTQIGHTRSHSESLSRIQRAVLRWGTKMPNPSSKPRKLRTTKYHQKVGRETKKMCWKFFEWTENTIELRSPLSCSSNGDVDNLGSRLEGVRSQREISLKFPSHGNLVRFSHEMRSSVPHTLPPFLWVISHILHLLLDCLPLSENNFERVVLNISSCHTATKTREKMRMC